MRRRPRAAAVLFAIASILLLPLAAAAGESVRCPGTGIRVPAWTAEGRASVCNASAAAVDFLRAVGLASRTDDLTIAPLPPGSEEDEQHVIGRCNVQRKEILVLTYEASVAASKRVPPAFDMPMSPALWQSFISHETAHAVAEQNFAAGVQRRTASEYIAAVVQLATLPPDERAAILARYGVSGFRDPSEISMLLYQFDPAVFAVMAYRHYAALGEEGPAFIARLLREGLDQ